MEGGEPAGRRALLVDLQQRPPTGRHARRLWHGERRSGLRAPSASRLEATRGRCAATTPHPNSSCRVVEGRRPSKSRLGKFSADSSLKMGIFCAYLHGRQAAVKHGLRHVLDLFNSKGGPFDERKHRQDGGRLEPRSAVSRRARASPRTRGRDGRRGDGGGLVLVSQGSRNHPRATRLRRSRMYRVLSPSAFTPRTTPRGSTRAGETRSRCYGRFAATRPGAQQEWRAPPR